MSIEALSPRLRYLVVYDGPELRALALFAELHEAELYADAHGLRTHAPARFYKVVDLDADPGFLRGFTATLRRPAS